MAGYRLISLGSERVFQMKIKPQNLLRSLLLLPYFAWGLALLFALVVNRLVAGPLAQNAFFEALAGLATVFSIAILGWGIPYSLLVVGLFLWSLNKPAPRIYRAILYSPLLLSILMAAEIVLIFISSSQTLSSPDLPGYFSGLLIAILPTLVLGYAFVGLAVLIYKSMSRRNLLGTEAEPGQVEEKGAQPGGQ